MRNQYMEAEEILFKFGADLESIKKGRYYEANGQHKAVIISDGRNIGSFPDNVDYFG